MESFKNPPNKEDELCDLYPCLPTSEHSARCMDEGTVCSDHVYQKLIFETGPNSTMTAITANMLGGGEDGAYRQPGSLKPQFGDREETPEWRKKRREINAEFVEKVLANDKEKELSFLLIQENNPELQQAIDKKNKKNYAWDSKTEGMQDCTLYNTLQYTLGETKMSFALCPVELGYSMKKYTNAGGQSFVIWNIHANYDISLERKENFIRRILELKQKENSKETLIFCGDWNCSIAPLDSQPRNICTAIGHTKYRDDNIQGALFPDGGFSAYIDPVSNEYVIKQAKSFAMNPLTGLPYTKEEIKPLETDNPAQKREVERHKMIMCLDHYYDTAKLIAGKTVFAYQEELREKFNDGSIVVRAAKNMNNQPGLGIQLIPEIAAQLKKCCDQYYPEAGLSFQFNEEMNLEKEIKIIVCVPLQQAHLLHQAINSLPVFKMMDQLNHTARPDKVLRQMTPEFISQVKNISDINRLCLALQNNLHRSHLGGIFASPTYNKLTAWLQNQFVQLVLQDENNPFAENKKYKAIHHAAYYGSAGMMKEILSQKIKVDDTAEFGRTPLIIAIFKGHVDVVKLLMQHHANINHEVTNSKQTPLECAFEHALIQLEAISRSRGANDEMFYKYVQIISALLHDQHQIPHIKIETLTRMGKFLAAATTQIENNPNVPPDVDVPHLIEQLKKPFEALPPEKIKLLEGGKVQEAGPSVRH